MSDTGPAALFTGALSTWSDAVVAWTEFPHLYELQRPKSRDDERLIAETFRPYLEARDWVSINRGEVISFGAPGASSAGKAPDAKD